jgi:hypothetical protein
MTKLLLKTLFKNLLLEWNKQLTKQQDDRGNTPLHFAWSLESVTRGMLPLYDVSVKKEKLWIPF